MRNTTYTKMKRFILTTVAFVGLILVSNTINAQVGIGTDAPTNTLHIQPSDPNEDPLRIENLKQILQGDNSLLVVDPTTGVVRVMNIDSIFNHLSVEIDLSNTNELQNAQEVPMSPSLDIDGDGIAETNVQEAIATLGEQLPKGTFRSIGEARLAGLNDGDSFWADPQGVFGCSGCVITLHPGMN